MNSLSWCLTEEFRARKANNPRYSMRSYARHLGVNPTSLSLYLRGRRNLSPMTLQRLTARLARLYPNLSAQASIDDYSSIDLEKMDVIGDWWYFAILSLCELQDFQPSPKWIAQRLNIPVKTAREAIRRMLRLKMLEKCEKRGLKTSGRRFATPDQVVSLGVRRSHYQALELARKSLAEDPIDERSFFAITMAGDASRMMEAHRRGKLFCRRLSNFMESGKKTQVYRLSLQIFPVSRGES